MGDGSIDCRGARYYELRIQGSSADRLGGVGYAVDGVWELERGLAVVGACARRSQPDGQPNTRLPPGPDSRLYANSPRNCSGRIDVVTSVLARTGASQAAIFGNSNSLKYRQACSLPCR